MPPGRCLFFFFFFPVFHRIQLNLRSKMPFLWASNPSIKTYPLPPCEAIFLFLPTIKTSPLLHCHPLSGTRVSFLFLVCGPEFIIELLKPGRSNGIIIIIRRRRRRRRRRRQVDLGEKWGRQILNSWLQWCQTVGIYRECFYHLFLFFCIIILLSF